MFLSFLVTPDGGVNNVISKVKKKKTTYVDPPSSKADSGTGIRTRRDDVIGLSLRSISRFPFSKMTCYFLCVY